MPRRYPPDKSYWEQRVDKSSGCWIWGNGRVLRADGYVPGFKTTGHKNVYVLYKGPIPEGEEIHHTCFNKACLNPDHLELKPSSKDHKQHHPNQYANATHCIRGHEFTPENTYTYPSGKRGCMLCRRNQNLWYMRTHRHPDQWY